MEQEYQDIEFRKYWEIIRKRKKSILIIFLIVFLAGLIFTILTPKTYESSVFLSKTTNYIKITDYKNVIATQLNIPSSQFDLVDLPKENLIKVEARGKTPEEAKNIADLVAKATVDLNEKLNADLTSLERKRIEEIKKEIEEIENSLKKLKPGEISSVLLKNQRSLLKDQLANWQYQIDSKTQKLEIVSSPSLPSQLSFYKKNIIFSLFSGFLLALLFVFAREYLSKNKS